MSNGGYIISAISCVFYMKELVDVIKYGIVEYGGVVIGV